jgi:pimeloyl-ACP methyl ester carboxylesterase
MMLLVLFSPRTLVTSLSAASIPGVLDWSQPTLLLIHYGGFSSAAWQRQVHDERLKRASNMLAMDAVFHGWTTGARREGKYSWKEAAENYLCALDKLFVPRRSV